MDRIQACRQALPLVREAEYQLVRASEKLDSARGWGVFDILGGGLISTLVKHGRMDDASACVSQAAHLMDRARALFPEADAGIDIPETGGFSRFADLFFDGLLPDLFVQGSINDQREAVERMIERVRRIERTLKSYLGEK